jgi:outer membrane lipoprotein-sorting protein
MDTDEHDRLSPRGDGEFSRIVLAAIDDIRREEPEEAGVERVIVRALGIPAMCDVPVPCARPEMAAAKNSMEPLGLPRLSLWNRITLWPGGLTMRQRIALAGVGVAIVLGFLLLWGANVVQPVSAMEEMAENIRKAKSFRFTGIMELLRAEDPGKPARTHTVTWTQYWLAPDSVRIDGSGPVGEGPGGELVTGPTTTLVFPAGKPGIYIDHVNRKFSRQPPAKLGDGSVFGSAASIQGLGKFSGQADRELGTKEIGGKNARGFEIAARKLDPNSWLGPVEVWIDTEANLPVLIRYETKIGVLPATIRMTDFQWNIDLDAKLFDSTPPEGYAEPLKGPILEVVVHWITDALRIYSKAAGGRYPQVNKVLHAHQTSEELRKMLGVDAKAASKDGSRSDTPYARKSEYPGLSPDPGLRAEIMRRQALSQFEEGRQGFSQIEAIQRDNPDAAYYGNTVGPKDKDKVLLRWKLDDGKYNVIFGDLRSETVTAERLRALEGR